MWAASVALAVTLAMLGSVADSSDKITRRPQFNNGDGSISVGDVWLYADTVTPDGTSLVSHSSARRANKPIAGQLIPNIGSNFYWPTAACSLPGKRILVTLTNGSTSAAADKAAILSTANQTVKFETFVPWNSNYVAGLARRGNTIYAYGVSAANEDTGGRTLKVATVKYAAPYVFHGWDTSRTRALTKQADTTVSVWRSSPGHWHMIYLRNGPFFTNGDVVQLDAGSPLFGDKTTSKVIATGYQYNGTTGRVHYNVEHHPTFGDTINNNWNGGSHGTPLGNTYQPSWID